MTQPLSPNLPPEQTRLALLYQVSQEISRWLNLDDLLPRVLQHTVTITRAQRGSLIVFNDTGRVLHSALMIDGQFYPNQDRGIVADLENTLAGWVVRHQKPALIANTLDDPRWVQRADDARLGAKSAICVPLFGRERVVGVLTVVIPSAGAFNDEDSTLLTAVGAQAGIAVENARLFAESTRREQAMRALATTAQAINATRQLEDVLRLLAQHAQEMLEVEAVFFALLEGEQLVYAQGAGRNAERARGVSFSRAQGLVGWVARNNTPIIVNDVTTDARFYNGLDVATQLQTRTLAAVPIHIGEQVIGVIEIVNPQHPPFDVEALELLANLATLAGTAIVQAKWVSELQAAEERFVGLFQDSIDPILITNLDGIITDANKKALTFFGFEEMIGLKVTRVHRTGTAFLGSDRFRHLTGGKEITYETRITTQAGAEIPVEVHAKLIKRGGQEFIQWIQHDLTERIALEELRNDLMSMVVHDLRSPLSNIMSSLDVLKNFLPANDESQQALMSIAIRSAGRLSRLVDSLLDLRRLEAGQMVLSRAQTNVNHLIADAAEQVQPAAEGKDTVLRIELPPRLPFVSMDGDMIRRVIINLMDNAVKYTPRGGSIAVGAKATVTEVTISVRDNGPGIPPSEHTRVFNKFARLQREAAPKGLGLGLAFCRLAVEAHGGKIWVESAVGRGSTFLFTLPL